ncbi:MAG: hypothetical protein AAFZ92_00880, partial [Pseudomonadota bacterium]
MLKKIELSAKILHQSGAIMDSSLIMTNDKSHFIEQLQRLIQTKAKSDQSTMLTAFTQEFFEQYPMAELLGRSLDDVFGMVHEAYQFIEGFKGRALIRVYNPSVKENYWHCDHTVVMVHSRNMPFIMDSIRMALSNSGLTVHSVKHTALITKRAKHSTLAEIVPSAKAYHLDGNEAFLYFEIDRVTKQKDIKAVNSAIRSALNDVKTVNDDYSPMQNEVQLLQDDIEWSKKRHSKTEVNEAKQFLAWLMVNNFTFLGYGFYKIEHTGSATKKRECLKSYGLLKSNAAKVTILEGHMSRNLASSQLLTFSKLPLRSSVHRRAYPDHITIKAYDEKSGKLVGEHHIIGLYTSGVYRASVLNIPVVREKVDAIYERINTNISSYNGKVIRQVLETFPRDELFQSSVAELQQTVIGIAQINERYLVRLFMRKDPGGNFVSGMFYIPRDNFSTRLREKVLT